MPSDGDRAKALLTYANYAKVAGALRVSRAAVADWAKGRSVTPYRLHQLEQLLRPDLQARKDAAPSMTRRLLAGVMALEKAAQVTDADLSAALTAAETFEALAQAADDLLATQLEQSRHIPDEPVGDPVVGPEDVSPGSTR